MQQQFPKHTPGEYQRAPQAAAVHRAPPRVREGWTGLPFAGESVDTPAQNQADVLAELVRKSGPQVDKIEDSILTSRIGSNRSQLSGLRRMLVRLQRLLAPEPAALFRLLNLPPAWIAAEDLQELRQSAEEFALVVGDCAALVERVKLIQEELVAMVNEQTNAASCC
jgi:Mg2+ and Co2+ transporter CorA